MRRRVAAGVGAAALGAATAVTALVIGTTTGLAESTTSSAYGFSAEGAFPVEPTPYVESTDGSTQTSTELELPDNPLIGLEAATVTAGDNTASVELLNVAIGQGLADEFPEPPPELVAFCENLPEDEAPLPEPPEDFPIPLPEEPLPADDLRELCNLLLTPPDSILTLDVLELSCEGDKGTMNLGTLEVFGQGGDFPANPEPNTEVPADPLLNITFNKQTENPDGSFTIEGMVVELFDGEEILTFGHATCGVPSGGSTPPSEETATAPAPVTTGLPVTG